MKDQRKTLGQKGEEAVFEHYRKNGYRLIEKNWRARIGEIDLIFQKKNTLAFIEVKTRKSKTFGSPAESITAKKQNKLINLVNYYLTTHKPAKNIDKIRIDAVEVLETDDQLEVNVIENILEL